MAMARRVTDELFREAYAVYERRGHRPVVDVCSDFGIPKQAFYDGLRRRGLTPATRRPREIGGSDPWVLAFRIVELESQLCRAGLSPASSDLEARLAEAWSRLPRSTPQARASVIDVLVDRGHADLLDIFIDRSIDPHRRLAQHEAFPAAWVYVRQHPGAGWREVESTLRAEGHHIGWRAVRQIIALAWPAARAATAVR